MVLHEAEERRAEAGVPPVGDMEHEFRLGVRFEDALLGGADEPGGVGPQFSGQGGRILLGALAGVFAADAVVDLIADLVEMAGQADGAEMGDDVAGIGLHGGHAFLEGEAPQGFRQRLLHHVGPVLAQEQDEVGVEAAGQGALHDFGGVGLAVGAFVFHPEAHAELRDALGRHAGEQIGALAVPVPDGARLFHVEGIVGIDADAQVHALGLGGSQGQGGHCNPQSLFEHGCFFRFRRRRFRLECKDCAHGAIRKTEHGRPYAGRRPVPPMRIFSARAKIRSSDLCH